MAGKLAHFRINSSRRAGFIPYIYFMDSHWPLQDAKNKLSELLETVLRQGAQTITRHGKPIAVVVSAEAYARLQPAEKLVEIMRDCPAKDWLLERDTAPARDLELS
jgi:prevent-host-death family protein